jgi:ABC-type polysaccharide/polyol phosphate export permease
MGYMETSPGLREVWRFREVIKNFVSQDLKVKYRRSFLGFFWSLLNPLLQMAVITVVFSLIFKFPMKLYALYVLSGLVPWSFWATSVDGCCMSIVSAESMLKRQYFPKLVFPISVIMQNLVVGRPASRPGARHRVRSLSGPAGPAAVISLPCRRLVGCGDGGRRRHCLLP